MCTTAVLSFVENRLTADDVQGRRILEVGAVDVNGSVRPAVLKLGPAEYVGVDIAHGRASTTYATARELVVRYGDGAFDVVISTEMLEHVLEWRTVLSNLKRVVAPEGLILLTTRSFGYPFHAYPHDYWRYEVGDMEAIFADFDAVTVEADEQAPGVLVAARRPRHLDEVDYDRIALYSMVAGRRLSELPPVAWIARHRLVKILRGVASRWLPEPVKASAQATQG